MVMPLKPHPDAITAQEQRQEPEKVTLMGKTLSFTTYPDDADLL